MDYETYVNTKDESPLKTLVNMEKEAPQQSKEKPQKPIEIYSHAHIFKYIAIAIAIIGFIAGIVCGGVFPTLITKDIGTYSSVITTEKSFNFGLMFIIWLASAGAAFVPLVAYCILNSMDNMLIELVRANRYHKQNTEKE